MESSAAAAITATEDSSMPNANAVVTASIGSRDGGVTAELHTFDAHPNIEHSCGECGFKTLRQPDLERHVEREHADRRSVRESQGVAPRLMADLETVTAPDPGQGLGGKPFSCGTCGLISLSRLEIVRHSLREHGSGLLQGPETSHEALASPSDEDESENRENGVKPGPSAFISDIQTNVTGAKAAGHVGRRKRRFKCNHCPRRTAGSGWMLQHIRQCHPHASAEDDFTVELLRCSLCNFSTDSKKYLLKHMERKHDREKKQFSCGTCSYASYNKGEVERHMIKAHPGSKHACMLCFFTARRKMDLDKHIQECHNGGVEDEETSSLNETTSFTCTLCKYKTVVESRMHQHMQHCHSGSKNAYETGVVIKDFACHECDYIANNKAYLIRHMGRKHDREKKQFSCSACSYASYNRGEVDRHMIEAHPDIKHACTLCNFSTEKKAYLFKHMERKHDREKKQFSCGTCSYASYNRGEVKRHMTKAHPGSKHACPLCFFTATRKMDLDKHIQEFHDGDLEEQESSTLNDTAMFTCVLCKYKTVVESRIHRHMHLCHPGSKDAYETCAATEFACRECDFSTDKRHNLHQHNLKSHIQSRDHYQCGVCGHRTVLKSNMANHMGKCHPGREQSYSLVAGESDPADAREYSCAECAFRSDSQRGLNVHVSSTHNNIRGGEHHCCNVCGLGFTSMRFVVKHMSECHPGREQEGPVFPGEPMDTDDDDEDTPVIAHACSYCDYTTDKPLKLQVHVHYNHVPEKDHYRCHVCDHKLQRRDRMAEHMEKYHPGRETEFSLISSLSEGGNDPITVRDTDKGKAFACEECKYTTDKVKNLNAHQYTTHIRTREHFRCDVCNHRVIRYSALVDHMKNHHPDREEDFTLIRGKTSNRNNPAKTTDQTLKGSSVYSCVFCGFVTCYEDRLETHVAQVHFVGVTGGSGSEEAASIQTTRMDTSGSDDRASFACDRCAFSTNLRIRLKKHMTSAHGPGPSLNKGVPEDKSKSGDNIQVSTVTSSSSVSTKISVPSDPNSTVVEMLCCSECSFRCDEKPELNHHLMTAHPRLRACSHCSFQTKQDSALEKHLDSLHPDLKIHVCPYGCNFVSALRDEVLQHAKVLHEPEFKERKYVKCVKCGFRTHDPFKMNHHSRMCHPEECLPNSAPVVFIVIPATSVVGSNEEVGLDEVARSNGGEMDSDETEQFQDEIEILDELRDVVGSEVESLSLDHEQLESTSVNKESALVDEITESAHGRNDVMSPKVELLEDSRGGIRSVIKSSQVDLSESPSGTSGSLEMKRSTNVEQLLEESRADDESSNVGHPLIEHGYSAVEEFEKSKVIMEACRSPLVRDMEGCAKVDHMNVDEDLLDKHVEKSSTDVVRVDESKETEVEGCTIGEQSGEATGHPQGARDHVYSRQDTSKAFKPAEDLHGTNIDASTEPPPGEIPKPKRFMCKHCFFETGVETKIRQHVASCPNKDRHYDEDLEQGCSSKKTKKRSTVKMHSCVHCEFKTVVESEIHQHIKNVHRPSTTGSNCHYDQTSIRKFKCGACDFHTLNETDIRSHVKTKHRVGSTADNPPESIKILQSTVKVFGCGQCLLSSLDGDDIANHVKAARCRKPSFSTQPLTNSPTVTVRTTEMFSCGHCPFRTMIKEQILGHVDRSHRAPFVTSRTTVYSCRHCHFSTTGGTEIQRHLNDAHLQHLGQNIDVAEEDKDELDDEASEQVAKPRPKKRARNGNHFRQNHEDHSHPDPDCGEIRSEVWPSKIVRNSNLVLTPVCSKSALDSTPDIVPKRDREVDSGSSEKVGGRDPDVDREHLRALCSQAGKKFQRFACKRCPFKTLEYAAIKKHISEEHQGDDDRQASTATATTARTTVMIVESDLSIKPSSYVQSEESIGDVEDPLETSQGTVKKLFRCRYCDFEDLVETSQEDENRFKCQYCGSEDPIETSRSTVKRFKCGHCDFTSLEELLILAHVRVEHKMITSVTSGGSLKTSSLTRGTKDNFVATLPVKSLKVSSLPHGQNVSGSNLSIPSGTARKNASASEDLVAQCKNKSVVLKYSCKRCPFGTFNKSDIRQHTSLAHRDLGKTSSVSSQRSLLASSSTTKAKSSSSPTPGNVPPVYAPKNSLPAKRSSPPEDPGNNHSAAGKKKVMLKYSCKRCPFHTFDKSEMYQHTSLEHGDKAEGGQTVRKYGCVVCGFNTTTEADIRQHVRTAHLESGELDPLTNKSGDLSQDICDTAEAVVKKEPDDVY